MLNQMERLVKYNGAKKQDWSGSIGYNWNYINNMSQGLYLYIK